MRFREMARASYSGIPRPSPLPRSEKVRPRQSFRREKLSATRYYGHAVGIAELCEGYFFPSPGVVHFSGESAERNRDLQSASKLGHG